MKWFLVVAAAALATAIPSHAQEGGASTAATPGTGPGQTVEGAHEFLRLITQQFPFVSADISNAEFYYRSTNIRFDSAGPCDSLITRDFEWRIPGGQSSLGLGPEANLDGLLAEWDRNYPTTDVAAATANRKNLSTALIPAEVNWSSVSSVKTYKTGLNNETTCPPSAPMAQI